MTDEILLDRALSGDETAFVLLYERHRTPIFRFAYRMLGSTEAAEDVAHDCFLSLIQARPARFDPGHSSLRTYLYGAVRNLAFNRLRKQHGEMMVEDLTEDQISTNADEPLRRLIDEERADAVRHAIARLPAMQREALILFEYEELSLAEIAAVAEVDTGTIKSRLQRARTNLKRMLAPLLESDREATVTVEK